MGILLLLFLFLAGLEFFLVTRKGLWRISGVFLPVSALVFWLDRQRYWGAMEELTEELSQAQSVELMLIGAWILAAIVGAVAGMLWDWRVNRRRR